MRNRKIWLYIKAALILLFTIVILMTPVENTFRKWLRFGMLCLFVASFIIDLTRYKKNNA